jgi:hypothetical protein
LTADTRATEEIDEDAWDTIEYPDEGEGQVTRISYKGLRLVVRHTRLIGPQATLWPNWRHFAFLTDLNGTATELHAFHRNRAVIELDMGISRRRPPCTDNTAIARAPG